MSCMFRAGGKEFNVDAFLASSPLKTYDVWRRGEANGRSGQQQPVSGFSMVASEAGMDEFLEQVEDAMQFLAGNAPMLSALANAPGWEGSCLDFGVTVKPNGISSALFPPELCRMAGELEVTLEVSIYGS